MAVNTNSSQSSEKNSTALLEMLKGLGQLETQLAQLAGNAPVEAKKAASSAGENVGDDSKETSAMKLHKRVQKKIKEVKKRHAEAAKKPAKSKATATPILEGIRHTTLNRPLTTFPLPFLPPSSFISV
jgi:hypothetical protein